MDAYQTKIYTAILISSFVLGTVIIYFAISILRSQRKNLVLQRMNILAEINAIEKEQARMAADLHDELAPTLTVIKFEVDSIETSSEEDTALLKKASGQLDGAVEKIREITRNMMPATLTRNGLHEALKQVVNHTNDYTTLHVSLTYEIGSSLSNDMSINIYRILQEIIQNAIRHSKADLLVIKLSEANNCIHIICEDNGIGFVYDEKIGDLEGIGLRNIKSRTDLMRGKFKLASIPGKGTQYIFQIPLTS